MQTCWKLCKDQDYVNILAKKCKNMDSRFHVQILVRGHLQRVWGCFKAWFWSLWLQWMSGKKAMWRFWTESCSKVDFRFQVFKLFLKFCLAVSCSFLVVFLMSMACTSNKECIRLNFGPPILVHWWFQDMILPPLTKLPYYHKDNWSLYQSQRYHSINFWILFELILI